MKRYLILCLVLALLLPCMVVPASATTQGVIDAIEDLQAGLGTSQRDIVDLLTSIWESIGDFYQMVDGYIGANVDFIADSFVSLLGTVFPGLQSSLDSIDTTISSFYGLFVDTLAEKISGIQYHLKMIQDYFLKVNSSLGFMTFEKWELVDGSWTITGADFSQGTAFQHQLYDFFEPLYSMLKAIVFGDTVVTDKFDEDMAPIETEVDEWIDSMETAPTINIEDIETEVDKVTDFETDANYLSILSSIFLNEAFLMLFTWCVILAMLGFILYGKR